MKPIFIGGLMRCCYETISKYRDAGGDDTTGTIVHCNYAKGDPLHQVIARDDGWHWNRVATEEKQWKKT